MLWELCPFVPAVIWGVFDPGVGECVDGGALLNTFTGAFLIVICKSGKPSHFLYPQTILHFLLISFKKTDKFRTDTREFYEMSKTHFL